jgi:hypothetical protein
MKCAFCGRTAQDIAAAIEKGWIPNYYRGQSEMPGPVCPECCKKHLRLGKDGEWETIAPPPDAHLWN